MSMKITRLPTYWNAGEAYQIITFLNELSENLWAVYGEDIIKQQQELSSANEQENQLVLFVEDEIDF